MKPETRRKRRVVRQLLQARGYVKVDTNVYRRGVHEVELDAAEQRGDRLRPAWAWLYDEVTDGI